MGWTPRHWNKARDNGNVARQLKPVAREEGLLVERIDDELVIFDTETSNAHCLSALAAVVYERCDGRTTVADMAAAATDELGEPVDAARIEDALTQLGERRLLEDDGLSRRDVMRRGAMVGAATFTVPLIASVAATPAFAGASKTCGGFRDTSILCCPCGTGQGSGKQECCTGAATNQCVCSKAEGDNKKYCKPAGVGAEGDTFCTAAGDVNRPCCAACFVLHQGANPCDEQLFSANNVPFPSGSGVGTKNCQPPGTAGCAP